LLFCSVKGKNKGKTPLPGIKKAPYPLRYKAYSLAAGEGFEPSQTESESVVLPLHNPAKQQKLLYK
jgi:hypothetical protein